MPKEKSAKTLDKYVPYARGFEPPSNKTQLKAISNADNLPAFEPSSCDGFQFFHPIPQPTDIDDWLAQYCEEGQSYKEFREQCPWLSNRKWKYMKQVFHAKGKTILEKYPEGKIYLLPLGDFSSEHCIDFEDLRKFAQIYLGIEVVSLPGIKLDISYGSISWVDDSCSSKTNEGLRSSTRVKRHKLNSRFNAKHNRYQIRVDEVLLQLRNKIPKDALCMIGLTMSDLYGDETDLFVAGMAAGNHRVAIFSFSRYDPNLVFDIGDWFNIQIQNTVDNETRKRTIMQRSCKLLVHEICHLLGIDHCIYFDCCMNGSGHLLEDFRQPIHLCPVDLHKLHTLVGFDVVKRYKLLQEFYEKHGMADEAIWVKTRIQYLQSH